MYRNPNEFPGMAVRHGKHGFGLFSESTDMPRVILVSAYTVRSEISASKPEDIAV